jgi:hypothetical protein
MNIYELEKQATRGPWSVNKHTVDSVLGYPAECHMGTRSVSVGGGCNIPIAERRPNARLIAHCRNHFMEALEALKAIYVGSFPNSPHLRDLIAELEEVK